jgi:hypothetical protein
LFAKSDAPLRREPRDAWGALDDAAGRAVAERSPICLASCAPVSSGKTIEDIVDERLKQFEAQLIILAPGNFCAARFDPGDRQPNVIAKQKSPARIIDTASARGKIAQFDIPALPVTSLHRAWYFECKSIGAAGLNSHAQLVWGNG